MLTPRYYQQDAFLNFMDYVSANHGKHPLIVLPTGCLSGDTMVTATINGKTQPITMRNLHDKYVDSEISKMFSSKTVSMYVDSLIDGKIIPNEIEDVTYSGEKEVFVLSLENGYEVTGTACHRIKTERGWIPIAELTNQDIVFCSRNGTLIWSRVHSITHKGVEQTFDIGCIENHNFVANGIVVHNSGKSLVQAMIVKSVIEDSDQTRVLLLTHQKELIKQNYEEIAGLFTDQLVDIGIYSAGLGLRDTKSRILLAGIQSVYKKAWTDIGFYDLIMIDEAHLVPHGAEGMYRTFLKDMQNINKNIVIAGLSATPYRLKSGLLCEGDGALFDAICHETSIAELMDATNWRNKDRTQYLCKLISPSTAMKSKVDLSQVHIRGGEFVAGELEDAFNKDDLIDASVKEIIEYSANRNKVLVFTAGKEHCENVFRHFEHYGQTCGFVHSDMDAKANDAVLNKFKSGEIKYLVNVNILTTGFNVKDVDCVAVLRSTMSPGLWVQICGRGSRLHPSKENCLILDFGGNIERHGPIDKIEVRKKKSGGSEVATAPQKACPQCTFLMPLSVMVCENCGFEFPSKDKHDDKASQKNILSEWTAPSDYDVVLVRYSRHEKNGSPDSLKVMYYYDAYNYYAEWVCLEHPGYAGRKAQNWIRTRMEHVPEDERPDINGVDDALAYTHVFKEPVAITVDLNEKFPRIVGYKFQEENAILIDTTKSTQ